MDNALWPTIWSRKPYGLTDGRACVFIFVIFESSRNRTEQKTVF